MLTCWLQQTTGGGWWLSCCCPARSNIYSLATEDKDGCVCTGGRGGGGGGSVNGGDGSLCVGKEFLGIMGRGYVTVSACRCVWWTRSVCKVYVSRIPM